MGYMILLTFSLLLAQLAVVLDETRELHQSVFQRNRYAALVELSELVLRYRNQTDSYPADLVTLAGATGYFMAGSLSAQLPNVIYQVAAISNATIQYQRVLVATQGTYDVVSESDFLSNNQCGSTHFANQADFCPDSDSLYFINESRNGYDDGSSQSIMFLDMTMAKLINTVESGAFYSHSGALGDGDAATLASMVGYAGTADNCTGIFMLGEQPLSCIDLFSPYSAAKVTYNFINAQHIALHVDLSSNDPSGTTRFVSRDIRI